MVKHSILKQTSDDSIYIDLYFSDRPDKNNYNFSDKNITINGKGYWERAYNYDLKNWLSHPDKTVKVDDGSKQKLLLHTYDTWLEKNQGNGIGLIQFKEKYFPVEGIEISPDVFEVRAFPPINHIGKTGVVRNEDCELAFFKEDKEETQEDLWHDIEKDLLDVDISADESEKCLLRWKQNFEIKRRKG